MNIKHINRDNSIKILLAKVYAFHLKDTHIDKFLSNDCFVFNDNIELLTTLYKNINKNTPAQPPGIGYTRVIGRKPNLDYIDKHINTILDSYVFTTKALKYGFKIDTRLQNKQCGIDIYRKTLANIDLIDGCTGCITACLYLLIYNSISIEKYATSFATSKFNEYNLSIPLYIIEILQKKYDLTSDIEYVNLINLITRIKSINYSNYITKIVNSYMYCIVDSVESESDKKPHVIELNDKESLAKIEAYRYLGKYMCNLIYNKILSKYNETVYTVKYRIIDNRIYIYVYTKRIDIIDISYIHDIILSHRSLIPYEKSLIKTIHTSIVNYIYGELNDTGAIFDVESKLGN